MLDWLARIPSRVSAFIGQVVDPLRNLQPLTDDDLDRWFQQCADWSNERRSEIVYATWTGDRE